MTRVRFQSLAILLLLGSACGDDAAADTESTDSGSSTDSSTTTTTAPSTSSTGDPGSSSTSESSAGETTDESSSSSTTGEEVPTVLELVRIGHYPAEPSADRFAVGAAEISAFDPASQLLFVITADADAAGPEELGGVEVIDLSDPTDPIYETTLVFDEPGFGGPTSVAVANDIVAVAVPASPKTDPGSVLFFDATGTELGRVTVGALPDMLTFTPDGNRVLVANEGEPTGYGNPDDVDPPGSVSIIDVSGGVKGIGQGDVTTVGFGSVQAGDLTNGARVFGPGSSIAQDLEPEYITISDDGATAWVTLQENNAIGIIDVEAGELSGIFGLGHRDHSQEGFGIDASNDDDGINITTWPVLGTPMPDAVAHFSVGGETYIVTANEGDAREYEPDGGEEFIEPERIGDLTLDPTAFPDAATLQQDENLGRLNVTTASGDIDGDGDYDELWAFGSRSISIYAADGTLVWDSGDAIERITAAAFPDDFNSTDDENGSFDNRSDDKGPEPEGLTFGEAFGVPYVFVGLERMGGVMVWSLEDPEAPEFVLYTNPRDFAGDAEAGTADDLAPEGLVFVSAEDSPTKTPLLIVSHEMSGTVSVYELTQVPEKP